MDVKLKRSFVLVGHAHSGKTSLAESTLFLTNTTSRKGQVLEGNTISDWNSDEIERKTSINASPLICTWQNHQIQFLDTPGYADFFADVLSSIRAVDAAVIVVDASSGIGAGTERAWDLCEELNLARIFFVNKLDKENTDFQNLVSELQENFSNKITIANSFSDQKFIETIAETDDGLLEKYLDGQNVTEAELKQGLRKAVIETKIFPVFKGSALNDLGVKELIEAVIDLFPSPVDKNAIVGLDPATKQEKQILPNQDSGFSAFIFKTIADPYVGQLTLMRVFSGKLKSNDGFFNVSKKLKERIGQLYLLQGKEQKAINEATCGDIVAVAKLKDSTTLDSLASENNQIEFKKFDFPEALISASVKPKTHHDEEKISTALSKLTLEDPTFKVSRDPQTKELIISGLGDLHLEVMVGRMKRRFNVEVELGTPKVPYKETITKLVKVQGKYKRQSGGRGQYGDVWLEIEPLKNSDKDFEFCERIFGGAIPKNYIPSVEKGVKQVCAEGALAGYPLTNIKVTLYDGSYHDVDSSDMAFQIAGAMALRKGVVEAGAVLLEPIMEVEIVIPGDYMGQITGDLNSRRGHVVGMDSKGKLELVKAKVPLSEMFKYANDLRSITGGRGSYSMKYSCYQEVPHKIAAFIIQQAQANVKHESHE